MDSAGVCRWYGAYGQPVPELGRVRATDDGLLTIGNADVLDSGNYTCSAVNLAGTTSRTVWIVVSGDCRSASSRVAWPGGVVVRALDWLLKSSRVRSLAVPFPGKPWARCLQTCASVTERYNLVPVKRR